MTFTPVSHDQLHSELDRAVVHFAFRKLDGTLRTAVGTRNLSSIPIAHQPSSGKPSSTRVIAYFDVEKQLWRAVSRNVEVFLV
jgi:hypothetical protein